ncbi:MAG: hypothetical protein GY820_48470 [Gammaproteobacteria bacterium]|nr:hypothetical protein [Gammaproteobacteria bacterium]
MNLILPVLIIFRARFREFKRDGKFNALFSKRFLPPETLGAPNEIKQLPRNSTNAMTPC